MSRHVFIFLILTFISLNTSLEFNDENSIRPFSQVYNDGFFSTDPEADMNVEETIRYHGYPVESYNVTTSDGYILTIQRIPHGLNGPGSSPRKPVIIQHGFLCSSASWVSNTKDKNLPYIMADAGYDVWLGNIRGNNYGKDHVFLSPKNVKFWEFSFDEMAKYDMPAIIDYILNKTGFKNVVYIGHSMGTSIGFAMLATQPKYNDIVKGMVALAPVAYIDHMTSPLKFVAPFSRQLDYLSGLFGVGEFVPNSYGVKFFSKTLCVSPIKILCSNVIFLISGYNMDQFNQSRLPVYLHATPAGSSVQTFAHFAQLVSAGRFQYYDGGPSKNREKYGQSTVPAYNLSRISTAVGLFWSDNDLLSDSVDVARVAKKLPNLVENYRVPMRKFSHLDFLWAIDVKKLVYDRVVTVVNNMWNR